MMSIKNIVILIILSLLCSCISNSKSTISEITSTDEFITAIDPYLIEDSIISREVPAYGVPTAAEALHELTNQILSDPSMNPLSSESEIRKGFDEESLKRIKIGAPILIYKFLDMDNFRQNYIYLFYASHPIFGIVTKIYYKYFEEDDRFELASIHYGGGPQILSQQQAKLYAEAVLKVRLDKDPIAVSLPDPNLYFYSREDFAWYFEIPADQESNINTSNIPGFLIDPYYRGPIIPEKSDLDYLVEKIGEIWSVGIMLPTRISRIENPLNLYNIVEAYNESSEAGEVDNNISWDKMDCVIIKSY